MGVNVLPTVIYSSMMGITLFALFEVFTRSKSQQSYFLAALLGLLLCHILGELFIYSGAYKYAPALAGAQFPIRMLLGPALFFYAFATMSPQNSLPMRSYFIALTGPLIVILGMIPFIFSITSEQKLALANPATRDPELFKIALTTCLFSMLSFIVFTGVYLVFSFKLQRNHRIQLMERFSDIEKRSMDWFRSVLILWGCVWFLFTLEYGFNFIGFKWFGAGVVFPIFEALILMTFIHFSLKQKVLTESDKGKPQIKQVRSALLSTDQMEAIAKKLVSAMQNETLYLEED